MKIFVVETTEHQYFWITSAAEIDALALRAQEKWGKSITSYAQTEMAAYVALYGANHCFGNISFPDVTEIKIPSNKMVEIKACALASIQISGVKVA